MTYYMAYTPIFVKYDRLILLICLMFYIEHDF